jgi:Homeodomain-like domain
LSRSTAIKQAKAARALRAGASQSEAARIAGVQKRTVERWLLDPDFVALVRHETVFAVGRLPERNGQGASTDPLDADPIERG